MCEPISLGAIFASIGSAFKFADFAIRIAEVGSENEVFVRTIRVVRDDLNEVERLLKVDSVHRKLANIPGKLPWVTSAVLNTKSALNEIGRWVERARSEQQATGTVQFETRVKWAFNNHEKLLNRKTELTTCYQQLSNVLSYLIRLEDIHVASETQGSTTDTTSFDDVLSRHNRKMAWSDTHANLKHNENKLDLATAASSHHVSQYSKPFLQSPSCEGNYSLNTNISPPSSFTTWPTTPPCSPPPTYNSVLESNRRIEEERPASGTPATLKNHGHNTFGDLQSGGVNPNGYRRDEKQHPTWAYEYVHEDVLPPEMPGDTVVMTGTNSMGPVNPFDFSPEVVSQKPPALPRHDEAGALGELLGDLTFAVELPANDAGMPPTYPPGPKSKSASISTSARPFPDHRISLPELPVMPRRRPVTIHANTHLGIVPQGTTSRNPVTPLNSDVSGKIPVSSSFGTSNCLFELPSSSHQPPTSRLSYAGNNYYNNASQNMSSNMVPPSSVKYMPAHTQSPGPYTTTHELYNSRTATGVGNTSMQGPPLQLPGPTSSARMRRQKDMMNLLGSLGS